MVVIRNQRAGPILAVRSVFWALPQRMDDHLNSSLTARSMSADRVSCFFPGDFLVEQIRGAQRVTIETRG